MNDSWGKGCLLSRGQGCPKSRGQALLKARLFCKVSVLRCETCTSTVALLGWFLLSSLILVSLAPITTFSGRFGGSELPKEKASRLPTLKFNSDLRTAISEIREIRSFLD